MRLLALKTRTEWLRQAQNAEADLTTKGAADDTTLMELADIDYQSFCLLVEALYALGTAIDDDVLDRASIRELG